MVGGVSSGAEQLLNVVREILQIGPVSASKEEDHMLVFRKDCSDLVRRISLLSHFLEEIRDNDFCCGAGADGSCSCCSSSFFKEGHCWWYDLMEALNAAMKLLSVAGSFKSPNQTSGTVKKIAFQFQCVTWRLEKVLGRIPYDQFNVSEEVQEQVALVRAQLKRATERYGSMESRMITFALAQPVDSGVDQVRKGIVPTRSWTSGVPTEEKDNCGADCTMTDGVSKSTSICTEKPDLEIPEDFLCPISLEIMRDPVIVSTGQTYERSCIQRWIDTGNATCPKTQQKLEHCTLTPNYVLRSFISHWCLTHDVKQPTGLANRKIKRSDGSFRDVSGDMATIEAVVGRLASPSMEERKAAVAEIRSLSKRSTDNRILIAEAGAIPMLVNLLTTEDVSIQENAVTCILNLSIFENNKSLIMLAGATPAIVHVLKCGTVEARENAAATLFSLSLTDENKIIIGASGAIPALVNLLENGRARGKKDAATALFNLCIYQGNKGRAARAGIVSALLKMLTDTRNSMVDEALTILSVLASNQEAKLAIVQANTLPVLVDLLTTGHPRNKENAAAILLSLCKRDMENLVCISRLGAQDPLIELAKTGTERAKRKAISLLDHLKVQQM